jgi:sugar lactone lactonase YvrE
MYYCQNDNPNHELVLLKRSPNGKMTTLIGSPDAADKERLIVRYSIGGMAFGADGALYLTDGENIYKVTTSGVVTTLIRKIAAERSSGNVTGENPSTRLFGLTVDNQGNVFAADFGHQCVLKITPQGSVTTLIQSQHSWSPTGVAFRNGDVYMLEFENKTHGVRVRKLAPDGRVTMVATPG